MALLEQVITRQQTTALIIVTCETLRDTAGVLQETQREILLLTLVEKLKSVLAPRMVLTQVSGYDFAIIAHGVKEPWHAITLGQQILTIINERLPIQGIQLRPSCSIGIAMYYGDLTAEELYGRAVSAAFTARRKGKIRSSSLTRRRWRPLNSALPKRAISLPRWIIISLPFGCSRRSRCAAVTC